MCVPFIVCVIVPGRQWASLFHQLSFCLFTWVCLLNEVAWPSFSNIVKLRLPLYISYGLQWPWRWLPSMSESFLTRPLQKQRFHMKRQVRLILGCKRHRLTSTLEACQCIEHHIVWSIGPASCVCAQRMGPLGVIYRLWTCGTGVVWFIAGSFPTVCI